MARRAYTAAEKAAALDLYREHGACEAARRSGIPQKTISSWAARSGVQSDAPETTARAVNAAKLRWEERRLVMVEEIGTVAHMALAQTENALIAGSARTAKDAATTMAILVDKAQLLSGAATARPDLGDRDAVIDDAEKRALSLVPRSA